MNIRWPGMRYTKSALLLFGLGLVLGFVAVVLDVAPQVGRAAAVMMALALVLLPVALVADGRGMAIRAWIAARLSRGKRRRRPRQPTRPPAARRKPPAKPASRAPRRKRR